MQISIQTLFQKCLFITSFLSQTGLNFNIPVGVPIFQFSPFLLLLYPCSLLPNFFLKKTLDKILRSCYNIYRMVGYITFSLTRLKCKQKANPALIFSLSQCRIIRLMLTFSNLPRKISLFSKNNSFLEQFRLKKEVARVLAFVSIGLARNFLV